MTCPQMMTVEAARVGDKPKKGQSCVEQETEIGECQWCKREAAYHSTTAGAAPG